MSRDSKTSTVDCRFHQYFPFASIPTSHFPTKSSCGFQLDQYAVNRQVVHQISHSFAEEEYRGIFGQV